MSKVEFTIVACCCLIWLLPTTVPAQEVPVGDEVVLRAIAEGYLANRESFSRFRMRYQLSMGDAASVEDAIAGRFEGEAYVADALWIVDGDRVRYERVIREDDFQRVRKIQEEIGTGGVAVPMGGEKLLAGSGIVSVRYAPSANAVMVHAPENPPVGIILTPFDFGLMGAGEKANPAKLIQQSVTAEGAGTCSYGGEEQIDDRATVRVEFRLGGDWRVTYWLAPATGFLPVQIESSDPSGQMVRRAHVSEFLETEKGSWLPKLAVVVVDPDKPAGPFGVHRFEVVQFEIPSTIAEDEFAIALPANTIVNDGLSPNSQFRISEPVQVDFEEAKQMWLLSQHQIKNLAGGLPPPRPISAVILIVTVVVIGIVLLLFLVRIRRSRTNQHRN